MVKTNEFSKKVRDRADFFISKAEETCNTPELVDHKLTMSHENALYMAEAYFFLSRGYKQRRHEAGTNNRTQPPKIAALTCCIITSLNPIRPITAPKSPNLTTTLVNPFLALRIASEIIDKPLYNLVWDMRLRFYSGLEKDRLDCLETYLETTQSGKRNLLDPYNMEISTSDLKTIENRINFFTILEKKKVFKDD